MTRLAGKIVDRIKVNATTRRVCEGRAFWVKRRRAGARIVLAGANTFFRLAHAPIRAMVDVAAWQHWEVDSFVRLHGDEFRAFIPAPNEIAAEDVPGVNLTVPLDDGSLTAEMAAAAGRELRRAHSIHSPELAGGWSHGDPHLGNFVFDPAAERARIIDFEVAHLASISTEERHADDLLVFLQDMVGRIDGARWIECATAFLQGYARPELLPLLWPKMSVPTGVAAIWWAVRTSYLAPAECRRRFAQLRAEFQSGCGQQPKSFLTTTHSRTG